MRSGRHAPAWATVVLGVGISAAAYGGTMIVLRHRAAPLRTAQTQVAERPRWKGRQILAVLIGSSECSFSQRPATRDAFAAIVRRLRVAAPDSVTVSTVGISVDRDPRLGIEVLQAAGNFDELIVGNGWLNTGAVRYAVRDFAAQIAVPQVLIMARDVSWTPGQTTVGRDSLQIRLIGEDEIEQWAVRLEYIDDR